MGQEIQDSGGRGVDVAALAGGVPSEWGSTARHLPPSNSSFASNAPSGTAGFHSTAM